MPGLFSALAKGPGGSGFIVIPSCMQRPVTSLLLLLNLVFLIVEMSEMGII
jgi:hypothetical protein